MSTRFEEAQLEILSFYVVFAQSLAIVYSCNRVKFATVYMLLLLASLLHCLFC